MQNPFRKTSPSEDLDKKLVFSFSRGRIPKFQQLKLLPGVLNFWERLAVQIALAIIFLAALSWFWKSGKQHIVSVPVRGGTYQEALVGTPRLINPILASADVDKDLTRLIYAGLLKYNKEGALVGDLATDFSVEEQGKTIRFHLRENLVWHDGEKLTAEDVKFTVNALADENWRSPLYRAFQGLAIEIPDSRTVIVRAKGVSAAFPHLFTVGIIPKHIWEDVYPQGARLAVWNIKPVGAGPFKFDSLTKSRDGSLSSYHVVRFDQYAGGSAYLSGVVARFYPDFDSALDALRTHTVDGVSFIPERLHDKIPNAGVRILSPVFPYFTVIFFQDQKSEVLQEKSARQALQAALSRNTIAKLVTNAQARRAPFLEGQVGFIKSVDIPEGGSALAREILTRAGWQWNGEGWIKKKQHLALTLTVLDEPTYLKVAEEVKKEWSAAGITVKLEAVSRYSFEQGVLRRRSYDALLFSILAGGDPDPYSFWHSSQTDDPGLNLSRVKSRALDIALEQGRSSIDSVARGKSYGEFQKVLSEEVPAIVLYSAPYNYAVAKRVRGVELQNITVPTDRFNDISKWFVRSRPGWR